MVWKSFDELLNHMDHEIQTENFSKDEKIFEFLDELNIIPPCKYTKIQDILYKLETPVDLHIVIYAKLRILFCYEIITNSKTLSLDECLTVFEIIIKNEKIINKFKKSWDPILISNHWKILLEKINDYEHEASNSPDGIYFPFKGSP